MTLAAFEAYWQSFSPEMQLAIESFVAGVIASFACGLGVFPLLIPGLKAEKRIGLGYGFTAGLMFSASVYNLLLPAFTLGMEGALALIPVLQTLLGMGIGCLFLWTVKRYLTPERLATPAFRRFFGDREGPVEVLIFIAMCFHSIPEGVAVGVGFASESHWHSAEGLGIYIAVAIAIHNIPEGLAVALPLRAKGVSLHRCFWMAVLTSLPQPIAALPSTLLAWVFEPLLLPMFGFAAGAMMYLVVVELLPDAMETRSRDEIAWAFMLGFAAMILVQVGL